jgi:ABC-type multidrug transport system ATPase subunit
VISCRDWVDNPLWLDVIYSFIPHLCIDSLYMNMMMNMGPFKKSFSYYWTEHKSSQVFLIMEFLNILLYGSILTVIEYFRKGVETRAAKRAFGSYTEFFDQVKKEHEFQPEVLEMEELVNNSHDFAVRIQDVSRLFFDSEGNPIPAVNSVSLGVKQGSLFGFLGANGAGKTTLIRMITSLLPTSNGSIEVNGVDIAQFHDPTAIAICPQFNRHLCYEMTPREHFRLYGLIFEMAEEETNERGEMLMQSLHLEELADKKIQELSQGDVRKLAIALSFFGPAQIILLDEPTASLDPVARRDVQDMILEAKGTKTFMLCTHLLSEAEFLCDVISIMVKGCLYTVGSPQMLTEKFGKDFKIDLMLEDESEECAAKVDKFFEEKLPDAALSIVRPKARIYDIPATAVELCELFEIMEQGLEEGRGFTYFTCSSSSLERVFMEIVKMSETE